MSDNDERKVNQMVEDFINELNQLDSIDDRLEHVEEFASYLRDTLITMVEDFDTGDWY